MKMFCQINIFDSKSLTATETQNYQYDYETVLFTYMNTR